MANNNKPTIYIAAESGKYGESIPDFTMGTYYDRILKTLSKSFLDNLFITLVLIALLNPNISFCFFFIYNLPYLKFYV